LRELIGQDFDVDQVGIPRLYRAPRRAGSSRRSTPSLRSVALIDTLERIYGEAVCARRGALYSSRARGAPVQRA